MNENELVAWSGEDDEFEVEEEDVLDAAELQRLAHLAEHPEQCDPVFLLVSGRKRKSGGVR